MIDFVLSIPRTELAGWIAAIFPLLAAIPYTRGIIRGTTKPSKTTWLIWTVVGFTLFWFHVESGARDSIWLPLVYALLYAWYALLSFRYGGGGWSVLDIYCLAGAALSWILWVITDSIALALLLGILTDLFGSFPTIRTAFYEPFHEDRPAWSIATVGVGINLFAVQHWSSAEAIYPLYLFLNTALIASLLVMRWRPGSLLKKQNKHDPAIP